MLTNKKNVFYILSDIFRWNIFYEECRICKSGDMKLFFFYCDEKKNKLLKNSLYH